MDRCLFGLPRARLWARVRAAPKCIHVRTIGQRHGGSDSECVLLPARRRDGIAVAVARERVTRDAPARSGSPAGTDEIGHSPPYSVRVAADPSGRRWRLDRFHRLVPYIFRVTWRPRARGASGDRRRRRLDPRSRVRTDTARSRRPYDYMRRRWRTELAARVRHGTLGTATDGRAPSGPNALNSQFLHYTVTLSGSGSYASQRIFNRRKS